MRTWLSVMMVLAVVPGVVEAQVVLPGNNHGTDGVFNPQGSLTVGLADAVTGVWDDPGSSESPVGIYDPDKWAVVFKYSEVNIPAGVTVSFGNHPSRAPVVWLVDGDVTIDGTVSLNGARGHSKYSPRTYAWAAPGGFRGGRGSGSASEASGGFGPGGGGFDRGGGSYGSRGSGPSGSTYGNAGVFPLIGGSGGAGGVDGARGAGGGGGGGALLIACTGHFLLDGTVCANGGYSGEGDFHGYGGGGSGGGIRIIADSVAGSGALSAVGGGSSGGGNSGGSGRIRVEANDDDLVQSGEPAYSFGLPGDVARLWPEVGVPRVRNVSLAEQEIPSEPFGRLTYPEADLLLTSGTGVVMLIDTENIPPETGVVTVRIVRAPGSPYTVTAQHEWGGESESRWTATFNLSNGYSAIQVHAKVE